MNIYLKLGPYVNGFFKWKSLLKKGLRNLPHISGELGSMATKMLVKILCLLSYLAIQLQCTWSLCGQKNHYTMCITSLSVKKLHELLKWPSDIFSLYYIKSSQYTLTIHKQNLQYTNNVCNTQTVKHVCSIFHNTQKISHIHLFTINNQDLALMST